MTTALQAVSPIQKTASDELQVSISDLFADNLLLDFSNYARLAVRGPEAANHIQTQVGAVPEQINTAIETETGTVLKLSTNEFWLLIRSSDNAELAISGSVSGAYPLFCQDSHTWLVLKSNHKAEIFAKLCAVDMSAQYFQQGQIIQTVVAGISAIVVYHQIEKHPVFSILIDRTRAHYLWDVMNDAMTEFI